MSTRPQNQSRLRSAAQRPRKRGRSDIVEIGIRLLDDAHTNWQWAELECEERLRAWCDGPALGAADRYVSYRAALDREEAAAHDLQRLWEVARLGEAGVAGAPR